MNHPGLVGGKWSGEPESQIAQRDPVMSDRSAQGRLHRTHSSKEHRAPDNRIQIDSEPLGAVAGRRLQHQPHTQWAGPPLHEQAWQLAGLEEVAPSPQGRTDVCREHERLCTYEVRM